MGCQDDLEVHTITSNLSILGLDLNPVINCHPAVSQARRFISECVIPGVDVKLGVPSVSISWWALKIPWFPLQRVGELPLAMTSAGKAKSKPPSIALARKQFGQCQGSVTECGASEL